MNILTESEVIRVNALYLSYKLTDNIEILYFIPEQQFTTLKYGHYSFSLIDNQYCDVSSSTCPDWVSDMLFEDEMYNLDTWTIDKVFYMEMKYNG